MFSIKRDDHKKNYTCISNQMLRDERLSLEAKGFMAMVLALPDDWEFSVRGMVSLCGASRHIIYRLLAELQKYGYLKAEQEKNEDNRFLPAEYCFCENPTAEPFFPCSTFSDTEISDTEKSDTEISDTEISNTEFSDTEISDTKIQPQINTNIPSIENIINTFLINRSDLSEEKENVKVDKGDFPEESSTGIIEVEYKEQESADKGNTPKKEDTPQKEKRYSFDKVSLQINAQRLALVYERTMVNRIAYLITDCINGGDRTINGEAVPAGKMREIFMKITGEDVSSAIKSVGKREIKNFEAYYTTTLYNTVIKRLEKTRTKEESCKSIDVNRLMEEVMKKYRNLPEE